MLNSIELGLNAIRVQVIAQTQTLSRYYYLAIPTTAACIAWIYMYVCVYVCTYVQTTTDPVCIEQDSSSALVLFLLVANPYHHGILGLSDTTCSLQQYAGNYFLPALSISYRYLRFQAPRFCNNCMRLESTPLHCSHKGAGTKIHGVYACNT